MDVIDAPSPNHDERPPGGAVDMLVLHYTGMRDGGAALARLRDPGAKVSAHYLIEEDGRVFRLVDEDRRAWHAGISCWAGERDINGVSIGIELVNPGHEFGYRAFPDEQMAALADLCRGLLERHPVPPARIVGHADVAPARKQDPGELFDWAALAAAGIGLWPMAVNEYAPVANVPHALSSFGYDVAGAGLSACAVAFQRHWRPARIDGAFDTECRHILAALLDAAAPSEDV